MELSDIKKYLPLGLTIGSCIGAVGVAYLSHKNTLKAKEYLVDKDETLSKKEELKETWKFYIPTGIAITLTAGCSIGAYILKEKQIAALATGTALAVGLINEYKDAIKEKFGDEGYKDVLQLIAKPHESEIVTATPEDITTKNLFNVMYDRPEEGNELFYDAFMHKWFRASKDAFDLGRYFINRQYITGATVSMKDFYDFMGVPLTNEEKQDYGTLRWSYDEDNGFCPWCDWIDITLTDGMTNDGEHYYIIDYTICEPECMDDIIETEEDE